VRIGTPFSFLIDFCGGLSNSSVKVVCGGPMMGLAQSSLDVAVTKTTSGLVALPDHETSLYSSTPCISCGRCIAACPMGLMPNMLSRFLEAEDYRSAAEWNVMDCMECGCCAYQCPSHRPLVQLLRRGKAEAAALERAAG
jgi:electron transport complex protein RnfC